VVGAKGFEPSTSWSRTMNLNPINALSGVAYGTRNIISPLLVVRNLYVTQQFGTPKAFGISVRSRCQARRSLPTSRLVTYLDRDMDFVWTLKHLDKTSWQRGSSVQIKPPQPNFVFTNNFSESRNQNHSAPISSEYPATVLIDNNDDCTPACHAGGCGFESRRSRECFAIEWQSQENRAARKTRHVDRVHKPA